MGAKVNELPQQAKLTLVTEKEDTAQLLKTAEEIRYQLMARIATRIMLKGE